MTPTSRSSRNPCRVREHQNECCGLPRNSVQSFRRPRTSKSSCWNCPGLPSRPPATECFALRRSGLCRRFRGYWRVQIIRDAGRADGTAQGAGTAGLRGRRVPARIGPSDQRLQTQLARSGHGATTAAPAAPDVRDRRRTSTQRRSGPPADAARRQRGAKAMITLQVRVCERGLPAIG